MEQNQVQPTLAPQLPVQPNVPVPAPSGTPKGNKGLIIGLVVGGALLVVGSVIAVVLVMLLSVSRSDYSKAYSQLNEVASANSKLSSQVSGLQYGMKYDTDTKFSNDLEEAQAIIEETRTKNKELSELKAVRVGEGKKKYQAFDKKLNEYMSFSSTALKSFGDVRKAAKPCDESSNQAASDTASLKSLLNECVEALDKISDTPDLDVKKYVGTLKTEMEKLSSLIDKLSAITNPYGDQYDQYKVLRDQVYDVQDAVRDSATDFSSNFEKHAKEVNPKNAADDLEKFLYEKIRG